MNREEADLLKVELDKEVDYYSKILNQFETNSYGLTPNHIRETEEWKTANNNYNRAFKKLREFNSFYVKNFMKKRGK